MVDVKIGKPNSDQQQALRITLPCSETELENTCNKLGINMMTMEPNVQVEEVWDDGMKNVIPEGSVVNMDELQYLAKRMDSFNASERSVFNAAAFAQGQPHMLKDMINLTFDLPKYSLLSDFKDLRSAGQTMYLQQQSGASMDEFERVDGKAFAISEMQNNKNAAITPYGVLFDHGEQCQPTYDGAAFPEYFYGQCEYEATLTSDKGVSGFLLLPTTETYIQKTLLRIGSDSLEDCDIQLDRGELPERAVEYVNAEGPNKTAALLSLNALCKETHNMYRDQRARFNELVDCIRPDTLDEVTVIAKSENEFELITGVRNAEDYGHVIAENVIGSTAMSELGSYIDFNAYGEALMKDDVGVMTEAGYLRYHGNDDEVLDMVEKYIGVRLEPKQDTTIKLYMPLVARTYDEDYGDDVEVSGYDLARNRYAIEEAVELYCDDLTDGRGLMTYYGEMDSVNAKVKCAMPGVEMVGRQLMGTVTMDVHGTLTPEEMNTFKEYWSGQMSDGWGEGFEQQEILSSEGCMGVSFWQSGSTWSMKTAEELGITSQPKQTMQMGGM